MAALAISVNKCEAAFIVRLTVGLQPIQSYLYKACAITQTTVALYVSAFNALSHG